ncbi:hypothetical protein [Mangrovihabitans endophyticus]|uniref:Uncharacterized protein n=1 Tax=Mangrovihabitans endophyticus TaxID=1751298 RepID=A0A8J3C041_9ACTN|nr:hypothetical protein [Mangrovihabitans endophyticus]GGK99464.1 hypothetical protein GCM10012284_37370 [Mangrovihabitans endophyticus]
MLNRLFDDPDTEVRAYDGRGGDGGIDVSVRQGGRLRIFQLKYFREGFSSSWGKRRAQIARSFREAMSHNPHIWVLVIPTNPTPGEEKFIQGLVTDHPDVTVTIMGRAELDSRLGANPDLVDYFTRDQLLEAARIYGQERAILVGGLTDLSQRHRDLARVADGLDRDWAIVTTVERGVVHHRLAAKHARAAEVSPITLRVKTEFGPQHRELASAFRRVLGFGTEEPLTLPPETVREFMIDGPSWLAAPDGPVEVSFVPARPLPETCVAAGLRLIGPAGKHLSAHQGDVRRAGSGSLGHSIEIDFYGTAAFSMLIGQDGSSQLQGKFAFGNGLPVVVLNTAALFRDLQNCHHVDLDLDCQYAGRFTRSDPSGLDADTADKLATTELLASDLDVLQRHCRSYFPVPTELSVDDRIWIRVARLLIEGHCVAYPSARSFAATLNGQDSPVLRQVLTRRDPSTIRVTTELAIEIDGRELLLGEVILFHSQVVVPDGDDLLAALDEGKADGRVMRLLPVNGESFRAVLPSARPGRDNEPLQTTVWGLPGLDRQPGG